MPAVGERRVDAEIPHPVERGGHKPTVLAEQREAGEARGPAGGPHRLDRPHRRLQAAEVADEALRLVDEEHRFAVDLQVVGPLEEGLDPIWHHVVEQIALIGHAAHALGLVLPQDRERHRVGDPRLEETVVEAAAKPRAHSAALAVAIPAVDEK